METGSSAHFINVYHASRNHEGDGLALRDRIFSIGKGGRLSEGERRIGRRTGMTFSYSERAASLLS